MMTKKLFLCLISALVICGCGKNIEEQAQEAVKNELHKTLYYFDSYEPLETKVDSAFNTPENNSDVRELMKIVSEQGNQVKEFTTELENAERTIASLSDARKLGGSFAYDYNEAVKDKVYVETKIKGNLKVAYENALKFSKFISQADSSFIGWRVMHTYRAKTGRGVPDIGREVYIFSKDFKKVLLNLKYDEYISLVDQIQRMNESLPSQAVLQSKIQKIDTMTEEEWRPILESLKRSVK
jgi:lipoprotein